MRISVVLTTHNRPALLAESVRSVLVQTSDEWELVIVDDGSSPPASLQGMYLGEKASRVTLVRRDRAAGPSDARNMGVAAAQSAIVTFLDDDDLLAPSAIAEILGAMDNDIDCLFVKVGCFGALAAGTVENQERALAKVLREANGSVHSIHPIVRFQQNKLFLALLQGLPMAFQRPALRREHFARIGPYCGEGFSDLEWSYRAALRCRTALLNKELYMVRCEKQSYFSRDESQLRLAESVVCIQKNLMGLPEVRGSHRLKSHVGRALCQSHFHVSWHSLRRGRRFPWASFARSCGCGIRWQHLSLLARALWSMVVSSG